MRIWIVLLCLCFGVANASENRGDDCRRDCDNGGTGIGIGGGGVGMGGAGGDGGDGGNVGDIGVSAAGTGIGEGGDAAGGSSTVNTESRSTSIMLGNAQDTADCFTKIQLGSEWFGIGFSRSDGYCKKVRRIFRMLQLERFDAAAKLECTLQEWASVYGWDRKRKRVSDWDGCQIDVHVAETPMQPGAPSAEALMVAQIQTEQYEDFEEQKQAIDEQAELLVEKQAQQSNLIESLKQELERVKAEQVENEKRVATRNARLKKLREPDEPSDDEPEN